MFSNDNSFLVNQFVSETCNAPERIFCPFCPLDYGFEFLLKDHVKAQHPQELKNVLRANSEVDFHPCPFCHAKFYLRELLPKHLVRKHERSLISMFGGAGQEDFFLCRFCPHKVLKKHHKLLMVHIEKKHYAELENYVFGKYSTVAMSCEDLAGLDDEVKVTDQIITPGLSEEMTGLATDDQVLYARKPILIKPILKTSSAYKSEPEVDLEGSLPDLYQPSGSVEYEEITEGNPRRRLRFDLPDSPQEQTPKFNMKLKYAFAKKKKSRWNFLSRSKGAENDMVPLKGSPRKTPPPKGSIRSPLKNTGNLPRQFKCGLCSEAFENNAHLLEHLRRSHKGLKLQARYRCGECEAKFYRNSFLVRHCWFHHRPRCLTSPQKDL
jgi:hypothetical protein